MFGSHTGMFMMERDKNMKCYVTLADHLFRISEIFDCIKEFIKQNKSYEAGYGAQTSAHIANHIEKYH